MNINWFGIIISALYVMAAITETIKKNGIMSIVYIAYALAAACLAFVKPNK